MAFFAYGKKLPQRQKRALAVKRFKVSCLGPGSWSGFCQTFNLWITSVTKLSDRKGKGLSVVVA